MIGWSIKSWLEDDKLTQAVKDEWKKTNGDQPLLGLHYIKQELN